jgi:hypothetical protein
MSARVIIMPLIPRPRADGLRQVDVLLSPDAMRSLARVAERLDTTPEDLAARLVVTGLQIVGGGT